MTRKLILEASAAALALTAVLTAGPVWAEGGFKALEGVEASPLSAAEMEAVQGRYFYEYGFTSDYLVWFGELGLATLARYPGTNYYYYPTNDGIYWYERIGDYIAPWGTSNWHLIYN